MRRLLLVLYNILGVPLLFLGAVIASFVNPKIRKGLKGRKKIIKKIQQNLSIVQTENPRVWIHVSSHGEFLQVKPVLSYLKRLNPRIFIIISFFSPSGYDNIPIHPPVDFTCYLPLDSYFQAKRFISIISPKFAVIVRHDIWPNFAWRLKRERIPLILIDASIPQKSSRLLPILKGLNRNLFSLMEAILAISDAEAAKFHQLVDNPEKITVIGDTKYDQVFERSRNLDRIAQLLEESRLKKKKIFVVGSSWQTDEDHLIPAFQQLCQKFDDLVIIVAPHEPTKNRIEEIENRLKQAQLTSARLSQLTRGQFDVSCLIIDQVGLLANIYYLGKIAFVGGSFHYKIHNVLEPAVYGIPVLFGPKITNSSEAQNLLKHDAAILVNSDQEIVDVISNLLENPEHAKGYGKRARQIVMQNVGSSEKIAQFLLKYL
ncbi:MAG: 3-deoxy-D-manno-octulosonic acid transferase [bacterium]|nr:MAG: 3-deoxy-D-manno-octulosonic acid transferase [bacterium]